MKDLYIPTAHQSLTITVREDSTSDEPIIREIFYENVYRLHDNFFSEDGVVLDVGANIGIFTLNVLLRAKDMGIPVKIYAFEPEPHNLELLKKNLDQNEWVFGESEVIIMPCAISDKSGYVFIDDNHGGSRLGEEGEKVYAKTLDEFVKEEEIEEIAFAKFDIEGSEVPAILATSDETLDKMHRIAIEFDEQNGLKKFAKLVNRFARKCQLNTLGVPSRGCYIYAERFE